MFDNFVSDLIELSKTCEFCLGCRDSIIRDRIVVGLRDAETIDKLLEQAGIRTGDFSTILLGREVGSVKCQVVYLSLDDRT